MDQKELDQRAARLQEVAKIIKKLPAEIRSEAFGLLKGYISQQAEKTRAKECSAGRCG